MGSFLSWLDSSFADSQGRETREQAHQAVDRRNCCQHGVLVLAPAMAVIAAAILVTMGLPIPFQQVRPGYHGRLFELVKFRTLREGAYPDGRPLPIKERITPLGYFLRRTSLDELPQLWNVIKGDMSLVGPRPPVVSYLSLYTSEQGRRHEVKPGLTGRAQAKGRHLLTSRDRFLLDVGYVDNWSLYLDMKIMAWTLRQALEGKGTAPPDADDYTYTGPTGDDHHVAPRLPAPTRTPGDMLKTKMEFRMVGPEDHGPLAEVFSEIGGSFFQPHALTPGAARRLGQHSARDVYAMLLTDGRPVAYGMLRGWDEGYKTPSVGIAVRRSARGKGYGRLMMAHLHHKARARGATQLRLRVHPDNVLARRL